MTYTTTLPGDAASQRESLGLAETTENEPGTYECYCGLGPACPIFGKMTDQQRHDCTEDKRRTAQQYYRNGIGW
jgi:hypothetical protein